MRSSRSGAHLVDPLQHADDAGIVDQPVEPAEMASTAAKIETISRCVADIALTAIAYPPACRISSTTASAAARLEA